MNSNTHVENRDPARASRAEHHPISIAQTAVHPIKLIFKFISVLLALIRPGWRLNIIIVSGRTQFSS